MPTPRAWLDSLDGDGALFEAALGSKVHALARLDDMAIISGSNNRELSSEVAYELKCPLTRTEVGRFADGEVSAQVMESVRGKDVFICQSVCRPSVNDSLVELLLLSSAVRRASAKTITAVVAHFPYKRSCGSITGEGTGGTLSSTPDAEAIGRSLTASDVARLLETAGVDRVITVELQPPGSGDLAGFFSSSVPVENVRATQLGVDHVARLGLHKPVVVAPNEQCILLAKEFASGLAAAMGGEDGDVGFAVTLEAPGVHSTNGRTRDGLIELVGDVRGHDVVIVDDLVDSGTTLTRRVEILRAAGARRVLAFATHALLTGGALGHIARSSLTDLVVTDTVPLPDGADAQTHKLTVVSVAPLLAAAILRVQTGASLRSLRGRGGAGSEGDRYKGQGV